MGRLRHPFPQGTMLLHLSMDQVLDTLEWPRTGLDTLGFRAIVGMGKVRALHEAASRLGQTVAMVTMERACRVQLHYTHFKDNTCSSLSKFLWQMQLSRCTCSLLVEQKMMRACTGLAWDNQAKFSSVRC